VGSAGKSSRVAVDIHWVALGCCGIAGEVGVPAVEQGCNPGDTGYQVEMCAAVAGAAATAAAGVAEVEAEKGIGSLETAVAAGAGADSAIAAGIAAETAETAAEIAAETAAIHDPEGQSARHGQHEPQGHRACSDPRAPRLVG